MRKLNTACVPDVSLWCHLGWKAVGHHYEDHEELTRELNLIKFKFIATLYNKNKYKANQSGILSNN